MSEWKKVKLGEITQIIDGDRGKNYPKNNEFSNVGYCLFLNTGNVTKEGFTFENNQFISKEKDNLLRKGKIQRGDLILTTRGTVGNIGFYDNHIKYDNIRINSGMVILRVIKDIVDAQFLYQLIRGNECRTYIKSFCTGSAQPQLPIKNLSQIDIKIPHLLTQHRIATILSRYDSLIENYQKQIKLLEEAAQRLYKEWFVDLHFPGYETTKIIDGVPDGWEKKKVGDITPIKTGKKDANFGTSDGAYPFFTCSQEPIKAPSYSFDTSAVILAGNGDFNVKLYRGKFEAYQRTYVLEPTNEKMLYLLYFCISENMNRLATGASGSTIKFLTKGMIESLVINKPSTIVLDSFNQIIEPIRTQKENLQTQIRLLTEARDRLLPKLMSGEIAV